MVMAIILLLAWFWLPLPQGEAEKAQFANAVSLQQTGQWAEAAQEYRSILARSPNWFEARANLGVVLGRLGRYEEAVAAYQSAIVLAPAMVAIRYNLGLLHYRHGRPTEAAEVLAEAVRLRADAVPIRQLYGLALVALGQDEAAIEQITPTVSQAAPDAAVLYGLGLAHLRSGRPGFRAVLERLASFPEGRSALHYLQGQAFYRDRQYEQALEELQQAIAGDPELPRLSLTLGLTYLQLGKPGDAIPPLTRAVEQAPGDLAALYHLADACQREGREEESLLRLDQALRLDPNAGEVEGLKGRILQRLGRTAEALAPLERAVSHRPDDPELRYALARLYQQLGRRSEAAREFGAVQRLKAAQLEADRQSTPRSPVP